MDSQINQSKNCVTVALDNLGCKLNQAETEFLARQLAEAGCNIVSAKEKADLYILNTCTVTHIADRKSRRLLRMARRRNPEAHIIALGCYAEKGGQELAGIDGIELIGNQSKANLVQYLERSGYIHQSSLKTSPDGGFRTRSFIKAQDGCNNFCTYCIVPLVRGPEKSLPPDRVVDEIRSRAAEGYQEVVLTGTEIGRYSYSDSDLNILLERILKETDIRRLRLSSLQPQELTPELIGLWKNPRLCRHFHLSLQSGSDAVLRRMGRRYSTADYAAAVEHLRSVIPEAAITTDIIVGFPGETEQEFEESFQFCQKMHFARMHIFPYSPREGTKAASMPGQVAVAVKKTRTNRMLDLAKTSLQCYHRRFLNQRQEVLFERASGDIWSGYTSTYIKVYAKSTANLTNRLLPVRLVNLKGDGVSGELVTEDLHINL